MKTNKIVIIFLSLFIFTFTGCEEEVLNKDPKSVFSEKDVWKDINLTQKFVTRIYEGQGDFGLGYHDWADMMVKGAAADIAGFFGFNWGIDPMHTGLIRPENLGVWGSHWSYNYENIRLANMFFNRIDEVEAEEEEKTILKGEVKYLRARFYHDLIRHFGGVPLITKVFSLDDDFEVARTPYEEIVDWIVNELDEAKDMVPAERVSSDWGRVNKGACLALKSNVLLYANSKLHDPGTEPSGPLYDYAKDTWQEVADAAMEVINMPQYSLVEVNNSQDYHDIFIGPKNSEMIFVKPYHPEHGPIYNRVYTLTGLCSEGGWGGNQPAQGFVDEFEMANGMKIDEPGSGYSPAIGSMYQNRELRFYANILYQGADFNGLLVDYALPDGNNCRNMVYASDASKTGYNTLKLVPFNTIISSERNDQPWIWHRLAEMYLNYAEAQYNLGNEAGAREYVNIIRNRVHLPDINTSGDDLFKDIQHERKIELCFEHHRFFDVRRWMIADLTGNKDFMGLRWKKVDEDGNIDFEGELVYELYTVQERVFHDRMYYIPIPVGEIEKTGFLQQNVGY